MGQSRVEKDHMTKVIFYLLLKQNHKQEKNLEVQVFLVPLLVLLFITSLFCFYLMLKALALD